MEQELWYEKINQIVAGGTIDTVSTVAAILRLSNKKIE